MTIASLDQLIAAPKQLVQMMKSTSRTSLAATPFSMQDIAGNPTSGALAIGNTSSGVFLSSATPGYPTLNTFGGGATGYLSAVEFSGSVAGRYMLFDVLFGVGAIAFTGATTTLSGQPSYSGRVPSGTDFKGTEIYLEVTTAFATGTAWQVQVTYTNQDGTAGRSTVISTAAAAAALILGRLLRLDLQAGDTGVQKIESVIVTNGGTAMTAGNFNILVKRRLWQGRVAVANGGDNHDFTKTGMPVVWATSALRMVPIADSTSTGTFEMMLVIANA